MDVRQLRHFVTVADTLHYGRAADRLGMTQPPLSQSIMALERHLGAPLFARTRRSVALTPFGELWLPHVRRALAGLEELHSTALGLLDGVAGHLELSFVSTADYGVLPGLVRRYASLYPGVEIRLTEATSDVQIAGLAEGSGHAGIVIPPSGPLPKTLSYRRLSSEVLVAAVPETWIEDGRLSLVLGRLPLATLIEAPLIIFPRRIAPAFHDMVTGLYAEHGARARIAQHAIQMQTIVSLVSAGMGLALVPASLRNLARTGVRYVEMSDVAPELETGVVWRHDDETPTLRHFLFMALGPAGRIDGIGAENKAGDEAL